MAQPQTVLRRKDTTSNSALYISFDFGDKSWQLSVGDDRFHVSRFTVAAGDTTAVASHILKAAARFKVSGRSDVYSVYEAGRDGWWFHRWLCELGRRAGPMLPSRHPWRLVATRCRRMA